MFHLLPCDVDSLCDDRDALVKAAVGTTSFDGVTYSTTSETLNGVMVSGTNGVNHSESRGVFGAHLTPLLPDIAIDGNAVLLTVRID